MRFSNVQIDNFRSIQLARVPLSNFVCAVGHNNAGKSSMLVALSLFVSGTKLNKSDFYDPEKDVTIQVSFDGLTDTSFAALADEHKERMQELVREGTLTLIRRYATTGAGTLRCFRSVPKDPRFRLDNVTALVKGKTGAELKTAVTNAFPELIEALTAAKNTQSAYKEVIEAYVKTLAADAFDDSEVDLPTGFDNSIAALMPEVVYIPAVKDITDDVKTKETSNFGRILKILLDLISGTPEIEKIVNSFGDLQGMLNRTRGVDGVVHDNRIEQVKLIESQVATYIREQFRNVDVDIEIPPPEMKSILSNARIFLDDGVRGDVETKGDGLKRAVTFALLRTFVQLRRQQKATTGNLRSSRYLFLFEEPELYLHPNAQRILYDALAEISIEHQVCVSTHSPYFFSAIGSGTFLRLRKIDGLAGRPPRTSVLPVDLVTDIPSKDAFQIICYENNSAAFFCDRVVLVEGDCDVIFLKHVARCLNPAWDFDRLNMAMIKIGGKGNFARYRSFFESFNVDVRVIADLDAIVDQFTKIGEFQAHKDRHSALIQAIDAVIDANGAAPISAAAAKAIANGRTFRDRYDHCKVVAGKIQAGTAVANDDLEMFGQLFVRERDVQRRDVLSTSPKVAPLKETFLASLRSQGVHVLSRGCVEDYYPDGVEGADKPTKALCACKKIETRDQALACCDKLNDVNGNKHSEFELIFENIFADAVAVN